MANADCRNRHGSMTFDFLSAFGLIDQKWEEFAESDGKSMTIWVNSGRIRKLEIVGTPISERAGLLAKWRRPDAGSIG